MTALAIDPHIPAHPALRAVPAVELPPLTVHQLARLRLVDLQARYLELFPSPRFGNNNHAGLVLALELMTREQLVEHVLEGRR